MNFCETSSPFFDFLSDIPEGFLRGLASSPNVSVGASANFLFLSSFFPPGTSDCIVDGLLGGMASAGSDLPPSAPSAASR